MYKKNEHLEIIKSGNGIIDCHTHVGLGVDNYLSYSYPYAMNFEDLVVRMKYLDIERSIVFPFFSSYYLADTPSISKKTTFSSFPYEKENISLFKEVYEVFPEHSNMAIPFAMFDPTHETDKQSKLLEELYIKYPFYGLKTVLTYLKAFAKDFDKPNNPIKKFAKKYNLPLLFHCSYHKDDIWANLFDILKIVENNPDLRFCLAHSARFTQAALEKISLLANCYVDTSALKIHCDLAKANAPGIPPVTERLKANYNKAETVLQALVDICPNKLLWGSDTPFHYFMQDVYYKNGTVAKHKLKANFDDEIKILRRLPKETIKKISNNNTLEFLFK